MNHPLPAPALTSRPAFSARQFRDALGMFATGVAIVTARGAEGAPVGMTISSFNSVSLTPPLVLWSMAHQTSSMPVFHACAYYAIHVLAVEQRLLAERFATRGIDRWPSALPRAASTAGRAWPGRRARTACR